MFVTMIISILVWPVGLLWNLWIQIKVKYLCWKTMKMMKKLEKRIEEIIGGRLLKSFSIFLLKGGIFYGVC